MSERLHRFTLLLVYSLCASFYCNSDEEEGNLLFSTSPARQEARSAHPGKTFSALTHASFFKFN